MSENEWFQIANFDHFVLFWNWIYDFIHSQKQKKKNMLVNKKFKKKYDWAMATHIDTHSPKVSGAIRLQSRNKFERKTRNNNTQQK